MARSRLESIRANQSRSLSSTEPLASYIPRVSPHLEAPTWLGRFLDLLDEAMRRPIRVVVAAPTQHGKTTAIEHALVRSCHLKPAGRSGYVTFNLERASYVQKDAARIARSDGVGARMNMSQHVWQNPETGGGILWSGRDGSKLQGMPIDTLLVCDDLLKNRKEATSEIVRQTVMDQLDDVALRRCHRSASIVVMATRWHEEDPSGILIKRGWEYVNFRALAEGELDDEGRVKDDPNHRFPGEALWPERNSAHELEELRARNAYSFASIMQGDPRPREGTLFHQNAVQSYTNDALPKEFRCGYGVDLAATASTSADWSVCIEGWMADTWIDSKDKDGKPVRVRQRKLYIVDVRRKQVESTSFTLTLKAKQSARKGPMRWYAAGMEKAAGQFITQKIPLFKTVPATGDKYVRATPVAEAWNNGHVLVPADDENAPEWLAEFVDEVENFTGQPGRTDDQVDALAALWDLLATTATGAPRGVVQF